MALYKLEIIEVSRQEAGVAVFDLFGKKKQKELKGERDRFVAFAFATSDALIELDGGADIAFIDGATQVLMGFPPAELIGRCFLDLVADDDREKMRDMLLGPCSLAKLESIPVRMKRPNGNPFTLHLSGYRLQDIQNHYFLTLTVPRGNTQAMDIQRRDLKTNLLKKDEFIRKTAEAITRAKAEGKTFEMTLVDFPDLKNFMSKMTEQQAAEFIRKVAQFLKQQSLEGDTAGAVNDSMFSVLHAGEMDLPRMQEQLKAVAAEVAPELQGFNPFVATVKMDPGPLSEQDSANVVLYTINQFTKHVGKDFTIDSLSGGYQAMLEDTVKTLGEFRRIIQQQEFAVAFQPIVDLSTTRIHHFEALVRFKPGTSFKNPFEFVTFGEELGSIGEFDLAMCQQTIEILQQVAKQNIRPMVSVNLSGKSLASNTFRDMIKKMLKACPDVNHQILFEITESSKIADLKTANEFIQDLRKNGNPVCLDDFGAGNSSFEYLRQLEVDFVKIDGSYVKDAFKTHKGKRLLKAMTNLCMDLEIATIGEMIEDQKIAAYLGECGVTLGQGYHFGKPTEGTGTLVTCSQLSPMIDPEKRARRVRGASKSWWSKI